MASRYAVSGGTGWNDMNSWASSSGGAGGAGVPTSSDDVFFDVNSPSLSIDVAAVCNSLDSTGYTNTLTQGSGFTLVITADLKWAAGNFSGGNSNITCHGYYLSGGTFTNTTAILYVLTGTGAATYYTKTGGTFTSNGGTVYCQTINKAGYFTPGGTGSGDDFDALTLSQSNAAWYPLGDTQVNGDYVCQAMVNAGYDFTIGGNVTMSGSYYDSGSGVFTLTGTGKTLNMNVTHSSFSVSFYDFTVTGTYTGSGTVTLMVRHTLTVGTGASLSSILNYLYIGDTGTVSNSGTISFGASASLQIAGANLENANIWTGNNPAEFPTVYAYILVSETRTLYAWSWLAYVNNLYLEGYPGAAAVFTLNTTYNIGSSLGTNKGGINFEMAYSTGSFTANLSGATINAKYYVLLRANSTVNVTVNTGTGNVNTSILDFVGTGAGSEILNAGSGTWTITSEGAGTHRIDVGGGTFAAQTATWLLAGAGTMTEYTGHAFYNLQFADVSKQITWTAGQTWSVTNAITNNCTSTRKSTWRASTTSNYYLNSSQTPTDLGDNFDVARCDASGGNNIDMYGSTDSGNNTNIDFTAPVTVAGRRTLSPVGTRMGSRQVHGG